MNDNRVVIVTGASRGLGAAVALWLGKIGVQVVLVARSNDGLQKSKSLVEKYGSRVLAVPMDVADPEACRDAVVKTMEDFGGIDGIVNCAAVAAPLGLIEDADTALWRYCMEVNVLGPFYMTKYSIPSLRERRGRIINVSSGAANIPLEAASAYCASKAALNHFTAVLAAEEPRITALSVRPGVMDTDMQALLRREGPCVMPSEKAAYYQDLHSRGLLEPPEVPARSIAWLVLHAPQDMSGEFRSYDDPNISTPALKLFGVS